MRRPSTVALVFCGRRRRVSGAQRWYFRVKARNGETIAASESYTRRRDAVRGATRAYPGARIVVEAP